MTVTVERTNQIVINGIQVSPEANIYTEVQFKPLSASGSHCAAGHDFAMEAAEVMPVVAAMRGQGFSRSATRTPSPTKSAAAWT